LPVTNSGKRSEAAARDALNGRPVRNRDALQNPDCLEAIINHPALRTSPVTRPQGQQIANLNAGDALERELQAICERVLGVSPIQWSDNFLQYGADSLTILNLLMEIEERTKCDLTLTAMFAAPTVARLASVLRGGSAVKEEGQVKAIVARLDSTMAPASLMPCVWWARGWDEDLFPAIFRWRYLDRASDGGTWMVFDEDQCVAMLDSFVRPYLLDGRRVLVREPADWFCLPKYRPLGFGLILMRMMMDLPEPIINIGGMDPTLAILPRLGWESLPEVQRMILPVTLRGLAGNLLRRRGARHAKYARAIPGFVPVRRPRVAPPPAAEARVEEWRPGSELALPVPRRDGLIELLESADLEWRLAAPSGFIRPIVLVFLLGDEPVGVSLSQLEPSASGPDARIVHLQISNLAQPVVDWIVSVTARRLSQAGAGFIRCRASIAQTITALQKTGFIATPPQAAHWWAKDGTLPPSVIEVGYLIANHALPFDTAATLRDR
jgi:acyl carrier protein